ncbi:MAG: DUF5711 family protein [Lachnospiraceae bacterium]|nr:DUF5711 family protein [Lachnospiraceae bacterium]
MSDKQNNNLRMVRPNWDEIKDRARRRRRRRVIIAVIIVAACVAAIIAYVVMMQRITYDDYTVTEEMDRSDTSATRYLAFGDGYVKYSNDGASYVTANNTTIWNQSYEMENPMVVICQSYLAMADRLGETIYILNEDGPQGEITVNMPILRIDVSDQGNVAILMEEGGTGYLSLYDQTGVQIAEGAIHVENTGTPMDIALSDDGENMAVSIIDVSSGAARTTINIYNFGAAGQNQIDNLVAAFQYEDTIVPDLAYFGDSTLLAFADTGVYVFEGTSAPEEKHLVEAEGEIQSIFYNDDYFGLVYNDLDKESGRVIRVYDTDCRERVSIKTDFSYDSVGFLDNHEICLYNSNQCYIYTMSGQRKFVCSFDEEILGIFRERGYRNYLILKEGVTEEIRLKILDGNFFVNMWDDLGGTS